MASRTSLPSFFATTCWTMVYDAARRGGVEASAALGFLLGVYWQPLYRYARRKGKSKEDAEDLVQGFMAHLTGADALQGIDRDKGRFRSFLLASFNHWMFNQWKHASRQKRGGGIAPLSFDWESAETGLKLEIADDRSPDWLFDREWALTLLGKVLDDLESTFRAEGNACQFEHLRHCLTADSNRISYAELAVLLGMSDGAVRVAVHRLRKRYRILIREEITRTLASPQAVEEEMLALFAVLAG